MVDHPENDPRVPLNKRSGLRVIKNGPFSRDLGQFRKDHGLMGCVLITFDSDRVGTASSAMNDAFLTAMEELADKVLVMIDDGRLNPGEPFVSDPRVEVVTPCDDTEIMRLWRESGLPEYFLGNGATNHNLVKFAANIAAAEKERIASAIDHEASVTSCHEDAVVVRDTARLVRADFSYEDAERLQIAEENNDAK